MRIFTAIMACALVFSACSKEENGLVPADDSVLTRAREVVGFNKVKLIDGVQIPAEDGEFAFELYEANKNSGTYEKIGEYPTLNGGVWIEFTEFSPGKKYLFREIPMEGWEPIEDLPFTLVANSKSAVWGGVPYSPGTGPTVENIPIVEEPVWTKPYESVTLTDNLENPSVIPGFGNHFCYVKLNVADLAEGVTLHAVVGNKFDKLGEATVKLIGDQITVIVDDPEAKFNLKVSTEGPVWQNNGGGHNNNTVTCPDAEIVYLYVHFDPVRFLINE